MGSEVLIIHLIIEYLARELALIVFRYPKIISAYIYFFVHTWISIQNLFREEIGYISYENWNTRCALQKRNYQS